MKRVLIAIFAGGLTYALLGGLIYALILGGFYEANAAIMPFHRWVPAAMVAPNLGSATGVLREVPIVWAMIVSQLGLAALVTYVFLRVDVVTASDGLKAGAIFGLLFGIAVAFNLYAVTNWSNLTVAFVEPLVTTVRIALGGAVIGWALGLGKGREIESSMGV